MFPQPILGIGTRLGRDVSAPAARSIREAQQRTGDHRGRFAPVFGLRSSARGLPPAGRFNIVIVFVIAEKYEILGRLVAGDAEGYDNR
jgi:hypothetical protein